MLSVVILITASLERLTSKLYKDEQEQLPNTQHELLKAPEPLSLPMALIDSILISDCMSKIVYSSDYYSPKSISVMDKQH